MKRAIVIVVVLIALIGGGVLINAKIKGGIAVDLTQYKVAKVEKGMVKKTVSATGVLTAWTTVSIKSKAGGRVDQMLVDEGDTVTANQKLAIIDPSDTQLQVDQAQADIDSAIAKQNQSGMTWELQRKQSSLAILTAQTSLEAARASAAAAAARLETARQQSEVQPRLTQSSIASAQANYESSVKQLSQLKNATNPQETGSARAASDQAVANEKNSKANLVRQKALLAKGFVSQQVVDQAQAAYDVAKAQVDNARVKLDTISSEQDSLVQAAQARVNQAAAQLESAKAGQVDIATRQSAYTEAKAALNQAIQQVSNAEKQVQLAKANKATDNIRRADIEQARASKTRATASFVNARKTLDQTVVRAPSEGVILKKYVEQGTIISSALSFAATGNDIFQLGDITRMYVDVTVDETDIANITIDQNVDVIMEAYSSIPFEGKVIRIDPDAVVEQNVTTVHVRVEVDNSAPAFRLLKPGMNATCEFIVDKKDDVLSVSNDAVHTDDQGKYVELASGGKPAPPDPKTNTPAEEGTLIDVKVKRCAIETGVEGNETTEIASGLKEGDTIVTQKIEATQQQAGGAFGGGGMPGMGRR